MFLFHRMPKPNVEWLYSGILPLFRSRNYHCINVKWLFTPWTNVIFWFTILEVLQHKISNTNQYNGQIVTFLEDLVLCIESHQTWNFYTPRVPIEPKASAANLGKLECCLSRRPIQHTWHIAKYAHLTLKYPNEMEYNSTSNGYS